MAWGSWRARGPKWALLIAAGGLLAVSTGCVSNPGEFVITVRPGSLTQLTGAMGTPTLALQAGTPACGNGVDDDLDGDLDADDGQCASTSDANERLSGLQAYVATTIPIDIDAGGVISGDPTDLESQQTESCIDTGTEIWCMGLTLTGAGATQEGSIDEENGVISIQTTMRYDFDALVGFGGLGAGCAIEDVDATFVANNYDTTTGSAVLRAEGVEVATTSNCGSTYAALLDGYLSLPGFADIRLNATILDGSGNPIQFS